VTLVRSQLNTAEFDQAWTIGQTLTLDEAIALALGATPRTC